jgi:regulator of protease activity HflC (stomatin/prohibitin superfamily)
VEPITLSVIAFVTIVVVAILYASIKIVNQYERLLVFTLGRTAPDPAGCSSCRSSSVA